MVNWERLAEQNPLYVADDLRRAGYRLVMEQVIYGSDLRSRTTYESWSSSWQATASCSVAWE